MAAVLSWPGPAPADAAPAAVSEPLIGVTVPSKSATVAPEQPGKLVSLPFKEGDRVEKDQVLFRLNSTLQELEVERLRPLAESNLIKLRAEANLAHAERQARRVQDLRDQDIASDADLQTQQHEVTIARLKLQQADIEQIQARNQLKQAIEKLEQRAVKSPFAGIVTQRMKSEGESVERFVPVLEVMAFDPLWIEFDCPMYMRDTFAKGSDVVVAPSFNPEESRIGQVILHSMKATAASHTFVVRIAVPNEDRSWKSGQKMLIYEPTAPAGEATPKPGK